MLKLIYDRSESDYFQWLSLREKGYAAMTAQERAQWDAGLKGAYNASDLNRVESAVSYLCEQLKQAGYHLDLHTKTNWTSADIPTQAQLHRYRSNIATLRGMVTLLKDTPQVPESMEHLNLQKANDMEKILVDIERVIELIMQNVNYAWTVNTADIGLYVSNRNHIVTEEDEILLDDTDYFTIYSMLRLPMTTDILGDMFLVGDKTKLLEVWKWQQ